MTHGLLGSVGLMLLAMSLIPLGDSAGKLLTQDHGFGPAFVAFARFAVGAALIAALVRGGVAWRIWADWRVWLRAALIAAGIVCILTALRTQPIADVFAAFFVGPIFSYLLSTLFLGERVTRAQTVLLAAGFAGVLTVVRPGFDMAPGMLFAVLAGLFYGGYLTASRWLADVAPPRQLMLTQTVLGTLLLAPLGLADLPPAAALADATAVVLLLVSGLASATGNLLLVTAYRRTGATMLAPFVYVQLVSAVVLGWAVFGTLPDRMAVLGMGVIVAAGLGTLAVRSSRPAIGSPTRTSRPSAR